VAKDVDLNFRLIGKDVSASKALAGVSKNSEAAGRSFANMGKMASVAIAGTVVGAALAAGVAIGKFATASVDKFGEVGKQTLQLQRVMGGTAESASRMGAAFSMSGLDTATATRAMGIFSKFSSAAGSQLDQYDSKVAAAGQNHKVFSGQLGASASAFAQMGVKLRGTNGEIRPTNDLLIELADQFKSMPAGVDKTALVLKAFGRGGLAMLPFLNKGAAGIKALMKQSDELGTTLSGSDLAAVKANTIAKREWGHAMEGVQITVGRYLYPILTKLTQFMVGSLIPGIKFVVTWFTAKLGPAFKWVSDWVTAKMLPTLTALAAVFMENVWPAIQTVVAIVVEQLQPVIQAFIDLWQGSLLPGLQRAWPWFQKVAIVIGVLVGAIIIAVAWILGKLVPAIGAIMGVTIGVTTRLMAFASSVIENFSKIVNFVKDMPRRIGVAAVGMWDGIKDSFKAAVNWIIDKWNDLQFVIGGGEFMGKTLPSVTLDTPNIPRLANGGIVSRPTLALIGEAGPEAVVPLSRGGGMGTTIILNVAQAIGPNAGRELLAQIESAISSGSARTNVLATR
jgi:hypothetical protein